MLLLELLVLAFVRWAGIAILHHATITSVLLRCGDLRARDRMALRRNLLSLAQVAQVTWVPIAGSETLLLLLLMQVKLVLLLRVG